MPWRVSWQGPQQQIVYIQVRNPWQWEDMHAAFDEASALIRSKPHAVGAIWDFSAGTRLPGPNLLPHIRWCQEHAPDNMGLGVLVGAGLVVELVMNVVVDVMGFGDGVRYAASRPEAEALLCREMQSHQMQAHEMDELPMSAR